MNEWGIVLVMAVAILLIMSERRSSNKTGSLTIKLTDKGYKRIKDLEARTGKDMNTVFAEMTTLYEWHLDMKDKGEILYLYDNGNFSRVSVFQEEAKDKEG